MSALRHQSPLSVKSCAHNRAVDQYGYGQITALASGARGTDQFGYRSELVSLVRLAESLDRR